MIECQACGDPIPEPDVQLDEPVVCGLCGLIARHSERKRGGAKDQVRGDLI